jgi:hypothetical protein
VLETNVSESAPIQGYRPSPKLGLRLRMSTRLFGTASADFSLWRKISPSSLKWKTGCMCYLRMTICDLDRIAPEAGSRI